MIIGLTGRMQAGKDTVADYLVENYSYKKVGYSDKLYEAVAALFGISVEEALEYKQYAKVSIEKYNEEDKFENGLGFFTWREFLQRFGTDMGREVFGGGFWVKQLFEHLHPWENYVVRDVRFDNEAIAILTCPFTTDIWEVTRPGYEGDSHASEKGIDPRYIGLRLENDSTLTRLYEKVNKAMEIHAGAY